MNEIGDVYERIVAADRPEVFITLRPQADVEAEHAASVAAGGALAGVLLAVKDNVDVAGLPTTAACPGYAYTPDADAACVAALRAAGAVVIGKTNLDQFATGLVGTRSPHGAVRDSRRLDRISGGSSAGSAVAVALGFADIAIGTDTAGSGRIPAALQGIVGIKPTVGAVSNRGVVPACAQYDTVTILAPTIAAAEAAMGVMATAKGPRPFGTATRLAAPEHPVLAVPAELPALGDRWRAAFADAVSTARAAGMTVESIDLSAFLMAAKLLYDDALVAQRYDAVGDFIATAGRDAAAGLDPVVRDIILGANGFSAVDLLGADRRLTELRDAAMTELGDADALMVPTAPMHPSLADVAADPVGVNSTMGTYTNFCNPFDLCGVAVPAGIVSDGADGGAARFGVTILARAHADAVAADLARRFLGALASNARPAIPAITSPSWPEVAGAPAVELAVFGAHMRGGRLAPELSDRGARWTGSVTTTPDYRLVALDTTPPKPGLIRDPAAGRAIEGESWTLSPAALGEFLAALPSPMALGRVELTDPTTGGSRWVVGFGCAADAGESGERLERSRW